MLRSVFSATRRNCLWQVSKEHLKMGEHGEQSHSDNTPTEKALWDYETMTSIAEKVNSSEEWIVSWQLHCRYCMILIDIVVFPCFLHQMPKVSNSEIWLSQFCNFPLRKMTQRSSHLLMAGAAAGAAGSQILIHPIWRYLGLSINGGYPSSWMLYNVYSGKSVKQNGWFI